MEIDREGWMRAARAALLSGACASAASAGVLAWRGHRDACDAAAPLNGPSQWVWGRGAPSARGASVKHTALGFAIHHAAATFWALFFERARQRVGHPVALAVATTVVANVVDYKLTPKRLQPGFERQLSMRSLGLVYLAFAGGLAASVVLSKRR